LNACGEEEGGGGGGGRREIIYDRMWWQLSLPGRVRGVRVRVRASLS